MIELAIEHREYILRSLRSQTASQGNLNRLLVNKYREEINPRMKSCSKCILKTILPAYKKLLDEQ